MSGQFFTPRTSHDTMSDVIQFPPLRPMALNSRGRQELRGQQQEQLVLTPIVRTSQERYRPQQLFGNYSIFGNNGIYNEEEEEDEYHIQKIKKIINNIRKMFKHQYFDIFQISDESNLLKLYDEKKFNVNSKKDNTIEENFHLAILKYSLCKYNESLDKFLLCERQCLITNDERLNHIKNFNAFCYIKLSKRGAFSTGVNLTNIAERYYLELYEDNYPEICANLGMFYLLRQNTISGFKYLTEGIEKKCGLSCYNLASHYITYNLHNKQDEIEQLFQKAIEYGYTKAYYNFAEYYSKNVNKPKLAKEYYIKAAEHEIKESFYKLANIYASEQNIKLYVKCIYNGYINDCNLCSGEFNTINTLLLIGLLKDLAHSNEIKYNSCIKNYNFTDLEIRDIFKTQLLKPVLRTVKPDSLEDGQTTPKRVYTPATSEDIEQIDDIECCICYEYDSLLKTKCGHIICSDCVDKIETTDCPMCRTNLI